MRRLRDFIKQNRILVIGIALPVFLMMTFYLSSILPKMLVKPPKTDLLYLAMPYPHDGVITTVKEGKLEIFITPLVRKGTLPMPRLFRFNANTLTSTEIPIILSLTSRITQDTASEKEKREALIIPALKNLKLDTNEVGPDGYKAEILSPNLNGAANLFLLNSNRTLVISKNGHSINVSDATNQLDGYKTIKFLGWVQPQ
jgi:hypothetical protein